MGESEFNPTAEAVCGVALTLYDSIYDTCNLINWLSLYSDYKF